VSPPSTAPRFSNRRTSFGESQPFSMPIL
jgi:hypothetical protein